MRLVVIVLVLVNVALAGWIALDHARERERAAATAARDTEAAPIRIVSEPASSTAGDAVESTRASAADTTSGAATVGAEARCLRWGPFATDDLPRARDAADAIAGGTDRVTTTPVSASTGWWVYLAPARNRDAAERKQIELKRLGVRDTFLVTEPGEWRFAISLGLFRSEDAARRFLDAQKNRGVRSAQIGERTLQVKMTALVLPGDVSRERLDAAVRGFAGTAVEPGECVATASAVATSSPAAAR
jgi:cell division septation protein DedD